ncbi:hypothetical protein [Kutzneria buriramensis]|uniref:Uncharacterized protein n=1 Tax=Kutzneria buriramensis TaxID=1045776 RepID=A0A3E0G5U5_9PSEU|nr:hypothetical protein [Kutzneria buriramensis]REH17431.1 hypothetical protein BCF44_1473 [Kutzneria buriramensis]
MTGPRPARFSPPARFHEVVYLRSELATATHQHRLHSWRVSVLAHFDDLAGVEHFEVLDIRIVADQDPGQYIKPFEHAELIGFRVQEYPGAQPGQVVRWFAAEQVRGRQ